MYRDMNARPAQNDKNELKKIRVLIPEPVTEVMDVCAKDLDLDRCKFIRAAIREKIKRHRPTAPAH